MTKTNDHSLTVLTLGIVLCFSTLLGSASAYLAYKLVSWLVTK